MTTPPPPAICLGAVPDPKHSRLLASAWKIDLFLWCVSKCEKGRQKPPFSHALLSDGFIVRPVKAVPVLIVKPQAIREAVVLLVLRVVRVRVGLHLFLFAAALEELGVGEEPAAAQERQHKRCV